MMRFLSLRLQKSTSSSTHSLSLCSEWTNDRRHCIYLLTLTPFGSSHCELPCCTNPITNSRSKTVRPQKGQTHRYLWILPHRSPTNSNIENENITRLPKSTNDKRHRFGRYIITYSHNSKSKKNCLLYIRKCHCTALDTDILLFGTTPEFICLPTFIYILIVSNKPLCVLWLLPTAIQQHTNTEPTSHRSMRTEGDEEEAFSNTRRSASGECVSVFPFRTIVCSCSCLLTFRRNGTGSFNVKGV